MAEEKQETRDIRLLPDRDGGNYGLGTKYLIAEPGKVYTVARDDARLFVSGGNFEYVGLEIPDESDLPPHFPARALLIKNELDSLQKVREATDERILDIKGIGDTTLAEIRTALKGDESNATD